jgi:Lon protease-like protein
MSPFEDLSLTVEDFSGEVRLFPLPDLVLFPHVMQPLHIFEPRYRSLLEDALEDDRLIAMSLLRPGWEQDYEGRPPLYPTACLGRVTAHRQLDDGTYNVLLLGLHRVRLVRELSPRRHYREARAELCDDYVPPLSAAKQRALACRLRDAFLKALPLLPDAKEQLEELVDGDVPLATLTDLVSYVLELEPAEKHQLLAEVNVWRRANLLLEHLSASEQAGADLALAGFPPDFSSN